MKRIVLFGLCCVASAATVKTVPIKDSGNLIIATQVHNTGVRKVEMADSDVVTIQARVRHNTMLIFPIGEVVTFAGGGDTDTKRWEMASPSKTKQVNVFYVKPSRSGDDAESDLNLITSAGHSYSFKLVSCASCAPDMKVFVTHKEPLPVATAVDPHLAEISGLRTRADTAEENERTANEKADRAAKGATETVRRERDAFREAYPLSMRTDFDFKKNKQPFLVSGIWTDDTNTYIQLAGEMTSIYGFVDGKPAIRQFDYRRGSELNQGVYVVSGVMNSGELRVGKSSKLYFRRLKK